MGQSFKYSEEGVSYPIESLGAESNGFMYFYEGGAATGGISGAPSDLNISPADTVAISESGVLGKSQLEFSVYELSGLLITEHTDILDLVVEVGVVEDFISIQESSSIGSAILSASVYDIVFFQESYELSQDLIPLIVSDDISIDDSAEDSLNNLIINKYEASTIEDFSSVLKDSESIFTYESFLITEHADILDIVLDVGVVAASVSTNESAQLSISSLFIQREGQYGETVLVEDYQSTKLDSLNLSSNDSIETSQSLDVYINILSANPYESILVEESFYTYQDILSLISYDGVSAAEYTDFFSIDTSIYISDLHETLSVSEEISVSTSALPVTAYDLLSVEESANVFDVIVELGISFDNIALDDSASMLIPELVLASSDSLLISEISEQFLTALNVSEREDISAVEYFEILDIEIDIGILFEVVFLSESAATKSDTSEIYSFEDISVSESADILDFIIELGIIEESVSAEESLSAVIDNLFVEYFEELTTSEANDQFLDALNVFELQNIYTTEQAELLDITVELDSYDSASVSEIINVSMSALYLDVSMAILTVDAAQPRLDVLFVPTRFEDVTTLDSNAVSLDVLHIYFEDALSVSDEAAQYIDVLNVEEYEAFLVTEDLTVRLPSLGIESGDSVVASESQTLFLDSLFVDIYDPFHVLISEHAQIIDLVIELGVVAEATLVDSYADMLLDVLCVYASDDVTAGEYAVQTDATLYAEAYDELFSAEDVYLLDIIIELEAEDYAEVSDEATALPDRLHISDARNTVLIGEFTHVIDLVVELYAEDYALASESAQPRLDFYFVSVSDISSVSDVLSVVIPILNVGEYDSVGTSEDIEVLDIIIELESFDSVLSDDSNQMILDVLNVDIVDPFHCLITEVAQIIDLIVEVGVVMEPINPICFSSASLDVLFHSTSDLILSQERVTLSPNPLHVPAPYDVIASSEWSHVVDLVIELEASIDSSVLTESAATLLDVLNVEAADSVSTAEAVEPSALVDMFVDDDFVETADAIYLFTPILYFTAEEVIAAAELILRNMPINFVAIEQRGMAIVTVSGW